MSAQPPHGVPGAAFGGYPPAQSPAPRGSSWRTFWTWVWVFIPVLTFGFLSPLPVFTAAVALRDRRLWLWTAGYGAAAVTFFALVGSADPDMDSVAANVGMIVWLVLLVACTVHAALLRRRVFPVRTEVRVSAPANQWALAEAQAARGRREEARVIVARDAVMARDLRIGRPDLPRHFDDGGLVDVNHVPTQVLMAYLGMDEVSARKVVEMRDQLGGFSLPEELTGLVGLPPATVDWIRDRLVFLRY